ncbi:MAG: peptidoglycan DD-metalloendopeptidase family protein [Neisseria sp.]|uniref:M23 family metallopeptidase n=1 Tax=Neisseria sp. TaxID=192066 RepID=UPI0026DC9075|nr:peptidoglycan DD-metalloendopeptidase family protein [Neisseria sp.]MDO4640681.1 peptidoglycan DD-metalloendopeptidase family protein [Neisseria sp.]
MKTNAIFSRFVQAALTCAILSTAACVNGPSSTGPVPPGYYRIQSGDNLYRIGLRFGQSAATLAKWNNLSDPTNIEVGQVIKVSNKTGPNSGAREVKPINTAIPMQWPVDNRQIIANYNGTTNKGIDFAGERGTPVKAAEGGKVLFAGEGVRGYGKLILISHNRSTLTAYAHNDRILVKKDQIVKAGEQIGTMGDSETDRVKLHFEVRVNGKAVNPMSYLNP